MTIPEMIEVLHGFQRGKTIEYRRKEQIDWKSATSLCWDFEAFEYRIKPEPREYWIVTDNSGYPLGIGVSPVDAKRNSCKTSQGMRVIKVREVLE